MKHKNFNHAHKTGGAMKTVRWIATLFACLFLVSYCISACSSPNAKLKTDPAPTESMVVGADKDTIETTAADMTEKYNAAATAMHEKTLRLLSVQTVDHSLPKIAKAADALLVSPVPAITRDLSPLDDVAIASLFVTDDYSYVLAGFGSEHFWETVKESKAEIDKDEPSEEETLPEETDPSNATDPDINIPTIEDNPELAIPTDIEIPSEMDEIEGEEYTEEETALSAEEIERQRQALYNETIYRLLNTVFYVNPDRVDNYLNVRSEPGSETVVGRLYPNNGGVLKNLSGGYAFIESGDVTGWVDASYIYYGAQLLSLPSNMRLFVRAEKLFLRTAPSVNARALCKISLADVLPVTGIPECGGWVQTVYEGQTCYASADFVTIDVGEGVGITIEEINRIEAEHLAEEARKAEEARIAAEKASRAAAEEASRAAEEARQAELARQAAEAAQTVVAMTARYIGGTKYEGETVTVKEIEVILTYKDGHTLKNPNGWACELVGVPLVTGNIPMTIRFGAFTSVITVPVIVHPTQPVETTPAPPEETQPVETPPAETQPVETPPAETTPVPPVETQPVQPARDPAYDMIDLYVAGGTPNRTTVYLSSEDIKLMAYVIRLEAGHEPQEGKLAVANVIVNRLISGHWGPTLSGVIYAPGQFSVAKTDENGISKLAIWLAEKNTSNDPLLQSCYDAAYQACAGYNNIGGLIFFCSKKSADANNKWPNFKVSVIIGNHVFYSKK
ncbi:MAG: cell wall hydrolase [Lachnospiraceae bacterium]|nr:cell wall hydrolase [Lachnospiraceae bacterium]